MYQQREAAWLAIHNYVGINNVMPPATFVRDAIPAIPIRTTSVYSARSQLEQQSFSTRTHFHPTGWNGVNITVVSTALAVLVCPPPPPHRPQSPIAVANADGNYFPGSPQPGQRQVPHTSYAAIAGPVLLPRL